MTSIGTSAPFLARESFIRDDDPIVASEQPRWAATSPFVSVYELEDGAGTDPEREAYAALIDELYDEEFDEALFELSTHAQESHRAHLEAGHSGVDADLGRA